jgi:hypothetical protein
VENEERRHERQGGHDMGVKGTVNKALRKQSKRRSK